MASWTIDWRGPPPPECRRGALAIGNFDGAHRGHAALLDELARQARASDGGSEGGFAARGGGPAVALTFDPHPLALLRPGALLPALTTLAERQRLLLAGGADHVVVLRTTPDLLSLTALEFFRLVIRE